MIARAQSIILIILPVVACSRLSAPAATIEPRSTPDVIVAGDTSGYPDGCNPRQVADLIMKFFEAYNSGDQEQLARFFSPGLQWYSDTRGTSGDLHFVTSNREELHSYFAERYAQREHLQLLALSAIRPPGVGGGSLVHIAFVYRRHADDIRPGPDGVTRIGDGKGAITCQDPKIYVWGMGLAAAWEDETAYDYWSCADLLAATDVAPSGIVCVKEEEEEK